jgi:hypothetical protein
MYKNDNNGQESSVEGVVKAVAGLVEKVPVYEDAIKPLAKETGRALETVGKAVNAALLPVRGLVWGIDKIEEFVQSKVAGKLKNIPPEDIQAPDLSIAGPTLESLRYMGHNDALSELYANLLATSMDVKTVKNAHPGFVEIIRSLSGDEAKILSKIVEIGTLPIVDIRRENVDVKGGITTNSYVTTIANDAGCEHKELTGSYLRNLERLGLIDIIRGKHLAAEDAYDRILNDQPVKNIEKQLNATGKYKADFEKYLAQPSEWGYLFVSACVKSKN